MPQIAGFNIADTDVFALRIVFYEHNSTICLMDGPLFNPKAGKVKIIGSTDNFSKQYCR